jgi:LemA protein
MGSDMFDYIVILLAVLILYLIVLYNRLVRLRESARNDYRQIDIQLDRRYKVFEQLISAVSKYMDYEKTVLKDVVALRSQAQSAKTTGDESNRMAAENAISKIASGINVAFEAYPDLKASQNVLQFQEEVVHTENKLSFAKQSYNDRCETFNAQILSFPANLVVKLFGSAFTQLVYWKLSEEDAKSKESYTAKL